MGRGHRHPDRSTVDRPHRLGRSVAVGRVDGRDVIVTGSDDGTVRVWDAATGTPIGAPLTGHTGWVRSVAVGRVDGRDVVVSGGDDGMVCCWDDATQHPGATLRHRIQVGAPVRATVVTDSGRLVVGADLGLIVLRLTT